MYNLIAKILVLAGAINWGLVALQNIDIVKMIVGSGPLEMYIKLAIGVAGAYSAYMMYNSYKQSETFLSDAMLKRQVDIAVEEERRKQNASGWNRRT
jgi:uncharacterized membrane protein YuzA (DUF378 family)